MIFNSKSVFLAVHASLRWLNNVSACTWSRFPCFFLFSRFSDFSPGIDPCFPLAGGLCKLYANAGRKLQIKRQLLLVQYKHQANLLLSVHKCAPFVISGNDKNKQLTLLSQRKLALTTINTLLAL
jgi:hypothetical protein